MLLLIDIGNTRIKWARSDGVPPIEQSAVVHAHWTSDEFIEQVLRAGPRPERVLISNVGGARIGELARAAIFETWQIEAQFVHSTAAAGGVRNAYPDPAKLGVDRWLALIGARSMERGAVCIASVGTAMTVDGLDSTGRHLGGVIVPGPDLLVSSLLRNTSEIAPRTSGGSVRETLFADNTLGAVQQGAVHALAALVDRALETMQRELRETPVLLLTGGAASRLNGALRTPGKEVPALVLQGLAVLAGQIPPARSG